MPGLKQQPLPSICLSVKKKKKKAQKCPPPCLAPTRSSVCGSWKDTGKKVLNPASPRKRTPGLLHARVASVPLLGLISVKVSLEELVVSATSSPVCRKSTETLWIQFLRQGGPGAGASGLLYGWAGVSLNTVDSYLGQHGGESWALLYFEGTSGYCSGLSQQPRPQLCVFFLALLKSEDSQGRRKTPPRRLPPCHPGALTLGSRER